MKKYFCDINEYDYIVNVNISKLKIEKRFGHLKKKKKKFNATKRKKFNVILRNSTLMYKIKRIFRFNQLSPNLLNRFYLHLV